MRYLDILEARRNPEFNPKITTKQALEKYRGRKDIFVSFSPDVGYETSEAKKFSFNTSGSKFGFNPQYSHGTPFGIYGYPLEYVHKLSDNGLVIPYGAERPFIWVMQISNKVLNLDVYDQEQYEADKVKLSHYASALGLSTNFEDFEFRAKIKTFGGKLWNITRNLSMEYSFNEIQKIPVLFRTKTLDKKAVLIWRKLFLYLGYEGVIDSKGIIHGNEPVQGVFFTKDSAKPIELIRNYNPRPKPSDEQIWFKNGKTLIRKYKEGIIPYEKVISLLNSNKGSELVFKKISFFDLPKEIRVYVLDNLSHFFHNIPYDKAEIESIHDLGVTDEQIARLLDAKPNSIKNMQIIGPKAKEVIFKRPYLFLPYLAHTQVLTIDEKIELFLKNNDFYSMFAHGFRDWLLDQNINTVEEEIKKREVTK